jgi:hypothetical protein
MSFMEMKSCSYSLNALPSISFNRRFAIVFVILAIDHQPEVMTCAAKFKATGMEQFTYCADWTCVF